MTDAGNIRWSDVRPRAERELEQIMLGLIDSPLPDVPMLQARAQTLQNLIRWFEIGAPADAALTLEQTPSEEY